MERPGDSMAERMVRAGVTDREAEVLSAVADRLRNREIADRLHVSVRTVESHIAALLRKLGVSDRAALAEMGTELRRSTVAHRALTVPLTGLVGRETETRELIELLDSHRLITLIGPGGVGKTRLATGVALAADRARFADLAPIGPELVGDTIARALGVVPQPGWPVRDVLREVAGEMRGLLLVDNCEHVVAEVAELVADLLGVGSRLHVLATSREPLGVPGEVTYPVRTLPVPDTDDAGTAATAGEYEAVQLFVERAATASPGFELTDEVAPAVAALVRRLDGLPLAIELAASRVRSFGPAELVELLDRRFDLLASGVPRTVLPRHRTLRGAIDWSYDLLDRNERALFNRLAVFPGGFDLAAVSAVAGPGAPTVITVLPRLVDKSLVSVVGRGARRYRLLDSIRAYAGERLAASGHEAAARQAHADHYLALAEQGDEQLRTRDQRMWLDRLTTEQPNLRAALAHYVAVGESEPVWRWVAALQRFWDMAGRRREAEEWIRRAVAMGDPPATRTVVAGLAAASHTLQPSDSRAAYDLAQRATELAAGLDDISRALAAQALGLGATWIKPQLTEPALHEALTLFGDNYPWESATTMLTLAQTMNDVTEALQWGRASVSLFRNIGDRMYAANTLFIMSQRAIYAGILDDEVHRWLTESRALAEAAGSEEDQAHATVAFGQLAWERGEHEEGARLMEQCLPTFRRLGDVRCSGRALNVLGRHAYEIGQLDRAEELLTASVVAIARAGQSQVLVTSLVGLAGVLAAQGRPRRAAVLLGAAYAVRESENTRVRTDQPPDGELRRSLIGALGREAFDAAHREGERLSPSQVL